jgi:hypothetical protein
MSDMSTLRKFALIYGIVFLLVGIAGFVPGLTQPHEHPGVRVTAGMGALFGLFAVNVLHNLVHLIFGALGLVAMKSDGAALVYARFVAIAYGLLAIMGLVDAMGLSTTFGLIPLYGHDVWLHALLAAVAAYFGFMHRQQVPVQRA